MINTVLKLLKKLIRTENLQKLKKRLIQIK